MCGCLGSAPSGLGRAMVKPPYREATVPGTDGLGRRKRGGSWRAGRWRVRQQHPTSKLVPLGDAGHKTDCFVEFVPDDGGKPEPARLDTRANQLDRGGRVDVRVWVGDERQTWTRVVAAAFKLPGHENLHRTITIIPMKADSKLKARHGAARVGLARGATVHAPCRP